ncbi:MAG: putative porin [Bacteroidales bacterium]|nr:putative porin [Bacteroidales bacterium]
MRKWAGKILVPAVMLGIAAVQSFGVDAGRVLRWYIQETADSSLVAASSAKDSLPVGRDSVASPGDSLTEYGDSLSPADSVLRAKLDSIRFRTDSLFIDSVRAKIDSFGYDYIDSSCLARLDSLEKLYAEPPFDPRDTIVIPDSLEFKDPFKYRYYYAIKDTGILRQTRDSLLAIPDSVELAKLDSLWIKDSTEVAQWRFNVWYGSLSRKERKKYDYEQALPGKIARMDSIMNRKDSIKAYKDSVKESTPRILETYILPDSLQYKRIVLWKHVPKTNDVRLETLDTTYNYHFFDYPFYKEDVEVSYLGVVGSPVQNYNYFKRREEENVGFYSPLQVYSYTPSTLLQYNTKTPYTELAYWGTLLTTSTKEESNVKILTTQNITPNLNINLEYHRYGGKGLLQNESTDNRTAVVATNYAGKRYLMHAGYIYNKVGRTENGGAMDQTEEFNWIKDTTVTDVREIDVRLSEAKSLVKKHTFFLDQSFRIPFSSLSGRKERKAEKAYKDSLMQFGDSTEIAEYLEYEKAAEAAKAAADTVYKNVTSAYFGHSSEFSSFRRVYNDNIASGDSKGRDLYRDFYYNPTKSFDSLRVMRLENRIYMRLQPWKADGIVSRIDAGIGDKLLGYYDFTPDTYLGAKSNVIRNSLYAYAGVQGQYRKYLRWDAEGQYTFLGHELNDFSINANVDLNFYPFRRYRTSPLNIYARFSTSLKEPDYYEEHIHTNHFVWDNDFRKVSRTKVEAGVSIPRFGFSADVGYALLSNNIYYDTLAIVRQNSAPMSVISASLREDFTIWKFHFENRALLQFSSNEEVMPLPLLALNLRYYFQFNVVKNVMQMQVGANAFFTTRWHAPAYNPALGVFHNQKEAKYGNCPYIDAFINIQWKRACIFLKVVNVNMGWPMDKTDYFSAHHYIKPVRAFKFGIFWPFYTKPATKAAGSAGGAKSGGLSGGPGGRAGMNSRLDSSF